MRDVLRVKGGITDYCVIGKIDVRSPDGPFKPVPDGFAISPSRRMLPKRKSQRD
jgi:hypothetical protein